MSTNEALNLDQAVEAFLAPEEPVQGDDAELDSAVESLTDEDTEEDVDSEVETSEEDDADDAEYDEEDDTDDESAEEEDEPDQVEPETITVKVDGEEVAVTLEDLKRSYSGQGKIQKGMQEAAEIRKQAMAEAQQANAIAQRLAATYQKVQEQGFIAPPKEPDPQMLDDDPIGYMQAKRDYDQQMKSYQEQQRELNLAQQYQQYQQQQAVQQQVQQEMQVLLEKIPELSDADKAAKFKENLVKVGSDYGYTPEDLAGVTDHRALMVLRDAMRWRQSQAKRSQVEKKSQGARPVIKPQAKKTQTPSAKKAKQARSNLKKSGSIEAAMAALGIE